MSHRRRYQNNGGHRLAGMKNVKYSLSIAVSFSYQTLPLHLLVAHQLRLHIHGYVSGHFAAGGGGTLRHTHELPVRHAAAGSQWCHRLRKFLDRGPGSEISRPLTKCSFKACKWHYGCDLIARIEGLFTLKYSYVCITRAYNSEMPFKYILRNLGLMYNDYLLKHLYV